MASAGDQTKPFEAEALHTKYLEERDKRLRKDAEHQYIETVGEFAEFVEDPYIETPLVRDAVVEEVDVAIIGGGLGGLLTAVELRKKGVDSFKIIEQGGDFGGTWYWNRYPGVRCDIESYIYMPLLEEVGTVPSQRYATGDEIFKHSQAIGRHFKLYEPTLFQTKVSKIAWDEASARWSVETDRGDHIKARFVTISQGPLAKVKLPGIKGIKTFKGKMFHSARWDYAYTGGDHSGGLKGLADKRVAVIGTGATAVQIIPKLAEHAKQLYVFQRTPSAIDVRDNEPTDKEWFANQPKGWQRERMNNFLSIVTGQKVSKDIVGDQWTDFWKRIAGSMAEQKSSGSGMSPHDVMQQVDYEKMEELRARISEDVTDPDIAKSLTPWYNYLCKRPLFSDDFLEVFNQPNVTLVDTDGCGVEAITEKGVVACGREHEVDCIIFATGFEVGAAPNKVGAYELTGRDGLSLDDKWANGIRSVHGTQLSGFPNFHIVGGTAQGTTAFNFTHTLDMQAAHAVELIARCLSDNVRTMEVTPDAEERWLKIIEDKHVDHTHFYEECTPGFLNNEGDFRDRPTYIGGTYGGGPLEYETIITAWRKDNVDADTVKSLEAD